MAPIITRHATETVDELIGSAYPIVKKVAQNIAHVKRVSEHISEIDGVFEAVQHIYGIYNNIAIITALSQNIDGIIGITEHFDEIMQIYNDLDEIYAAQASATAAVLLARNWANADFGTEIELGMYSAKHWSIASQNSADASSLAASVASGHAVAASASATASQVSRVASEAARDAAIIAENAAELAETNAEAILADTIIARNAAQTAQTAAELAETHAETAETNAETAQAAAEAARNTAQTHATNAGNSATAASGSASTATTQAGIATTKAAEALASANAADASADAALVSEQNADASEAAALGYRNTAQTHATNAGTAQTNAEAARDAAITAKNAAETAETNAETAETNAETAQALAEAARDAAVVAKTAAELAETHAETAETNAETAETNAVAAKVAAEAARDTAVAASAISGGIRYQWDTGITAADPGSGKIRGNNTIDAATSLYISETDFHGADIGAFIGTWDDTPNTPRGHITIRKVGASQNFVVYAINGNIADNGAYRTIPVSMVDYQGSFSADDDLTIEVVRLGQASVAGITQNYSNTVTEADPGNGIFRFNDTTLASVTEMYLDLLDNQGNSIQNWLDSLDDSSSTVKGYLYFRGVSSINAFAVYKVNAITTQTGYRKLSVTYLNAGGSWGNGSTFAMSFSPSGDAGSGAVTTVNGASGNVVLDPDDLDDTATTNKWANAAEKLKLSYIAVTQAVDLDSIENDVAAAKAKTDWITVTQAVDLDAIEARVNALDAAVVLKGTWDASSGTFPGGGTAQAGESYIVSVAGTVDGVSFNINDRVIALVDNASTTTFSPNWFKADYTDQVLSVAGLVGAITAGGLKTALAIAVADVTDMSANGRSLTQAANYAAMKTLLELNNVDNTSSTTLFDNIAGRIRGRNRQTGTTYTFVLSDDGKLVEGNNASAQTYTVPPNSSVAYAVDTTVINIGQYGAGQITIAAGAGVTIRSAGGALKLRTQYSTASLKKIGTDEWWLFGDITT